MTNISLPNYTTTINSPIHQAIQQTIHPHTKIQWVWGNTVSWGWVETLGLLGSSPTQSYNNHYHTPTHQHPVGLGQHCQQRLGGNPRLTRIITYTIIQQPLPYTNIQWAWGNLHCQLRLGGNPRLTRMITYTIIQQPLPIPYTNTSTSSELGATYTVSWGWVETLGLPQHHDLYDQLINK